MVDKVSIEGSKERAADRGQDLLFEALPSGASLASMEIVEHVVRQYLGELLDIRMDYHADKIDGDSAVQAIDKAATQYADMFMGKSSDFPGTNWNTPEGLGTYLLAVLDTDSKPEDSARDLFLRIASDFSKAVILPNEEDELDEEEATFRTDAIVEDAVHALLGLPNSEPEA